MKASSPSIYVSAVALLAAIRWSDIAFAFVIQPNGCGSLPGVRQLDTTALRLAPTGSADESFEYGHDHDATIKGLNLVVKYGGNAMTSDALKALFCADVAALTARGARVTVVHGGGPQINQLLDRTGVKSEFSPGGLRISSKEVVDIAEMVLSGSVNKEIASRICRSSSGGTTPVSAIGISGRDGNLLQCVQEDPALGNVGRVVKVNAALLKLILDQNICPVVAPIGCGLLDMDDETVYNVNADVAAGQVAAALAADRLIFLTDIAGVLDGQKQLLEQLTVADVQRLIDDQTITGGMIPKVNYAVSAVQNNVRAATITDGRVPHALWKEVTGMGGSGTAITM